MNKYFYLPGYYMRSIAMQIFLNYMDSHPEYFISDRKVIGAYDLPEGLIWNGGRNTSKDNSKVNYNDTIVKHIIEYWQARSNFILLHTCTNLLINTEERLHDKLCNNFIQKYYRPQDKIIIANPTLKQYLKETYPQISFVNSTCLGITDIDKVNDISKNEHYVLNYNKNGDNEYLNKLKYPENIEILCGEHCILNCPNRNNHYKEISEAQLNLKSFDPKESECPFFSVHDKKLSNLPMLVQQSVHRVPNYRIEELSKMGFQYFKISGRSWDPIMWIQLPIYYLVRPEYQKLVYKNLYNLFITLF